MLEGSVAHVEYCETAGASLVVVVLRSLVGLCDGVPRDGDCRPRHHPQKVSVGFFRTPNLGFSTYLLYVATFKKI